MQNVEYFSVLHCGQVGSVSKNLKVDDGSGCGKVVITLQFVPTPKCS